MQHFIDVSTLPYRATAVGTEVLNAKGQLILQGVDEKVAADLVEMSYIVLKHANTMAASHIRRNPAYDD